MPEPPANLASLDQEREFLQQENARLRATVEQLMNRLQESEERIRALGHRQIDSLVVEQQKQTSCSLQAIDAVYRSIVESCFPYGIWLADAAGKLLYASPSFLNLLQTDLQELQQKGRFHFLPPEVREIIDREWLQTENQGIPCNVEYKIRQQDGSERIIWTHGTLNHSILGGPYWVGANIDVTERNRQRDELRQQAEALKEKTRQLEQAVASLQQARDELEQRVEQRTRELTVLNENLHREISEHQATENRLRERAEEIEKLMEVLPVPVLIALDTQCQRMISNRACQTLFRMTETKFLTQDPHPFKDFPFRILRNGVEILEQELPIQQAIEMKKEIKKVLLELSFADGSTRKIETSAAPLFDTQGYPRGAIGVMVDVTERQRLEDHLRQSEERYRTVVEDQTEVVIRVRPDRTFTFANDVFCRTFGIRREDLIGRKWPSVVYPEDLNRVAQEISQISPTNPIVQIENRVIVANGKIRWMEWINRGFFDPSGELLEIQSVGRDVTDRKQAEAEIAASLEEKQVLLKEIHHRVKNNLQVICSLLDLQSHYALDEATRSMFRESQMRVRSMALVHERIYQAEIFSSIDFDEYLQSLITQMADCYAPVANQAIRFDLKLEALRLSISEAIPCGLLVNELVSNCLKHAFPSGRGTIRISLIRAGEQANLVVQDDGIGISDTVGTAAPKTFGLQLVEALVKQIHGQLTIERQNGTRVQITFPLGNKSHKQ